MINLSFQFSCKNSQIGLKNVNIKMSDPHHHFDKFSVYFLSEYFFMQSLLIQIYRRLRHTTLNTEQSHLAIKVSADN